MCILFIFTDPNPSEGSYRLIVASNRDEFYKRPAKTAMLCNETGIIGGYDMEKTREGGMWLGAKVKKNGESKVCFGALLNVTGEDKKSGVVGRGFIVKNYLTHQADLDSYLSTLENPNIIYSAFNFVSVELSKDDAKTVHYSNAPLSRDNYDGKQFLGFGNSTTKNPLTKVINGKERFKNIVENKLPRDKLINELLNLLKSEIRNLPDPELQRRAPMQFEFLSQVYVKILEGGYGTRTHSVLLVDYDWNVEFIEHTMKEPITNPDNPKWEINCVKSNL